MMFDDAFTFREFLIFLQGLGLGVLLSCLASFALGWAERRQARLAPDDPYSGPFADADHWTGHRNQFRK